MSPSGAWLQLVAYSPGGGHAGFYEIIQNENETKTLTYKTYQFSPGYNTMNNQPSNAVIVDVFAQVLLG